MNTAFVHSCSHSLCCLVMVGGVSGGCLPDDVSPPKKSTLVNGKVG